MEPILYFQSTDHLEPKCPGCGSKIDYGTSTRFDDSQEAHICLSCNTRL